MITKDVEVVQIVRVTVDETKFTPEFLEAWPEVFYPFTTIEQHMEHLAQLEARGLIGGGDSFIEGYGQQQDFGIKTEVIDQSQDIL